MARPQFGRRVKWFAAHKLPSDEHGGQSRDEPSGMSQVDVGDGGFLMLVDGANRIIYHPNKELLGKPYALPIPLDQLVGLSGEFFTGELDGKNYFFSHVVTRRGGWHFISALHEKTIIAQTAWMNLVTFLAIFSASVWWRSLQWRFIRRSSTQFRKLFRASRDLIPVS
jgi:hypothetical protein